MRSLWRAESLVFKGRSDPASAFVWKQECLECGLFQETSLYLTLLQLIITTAATRAGEKIGSPKLPGVTGIRQCADMTQKKFTPDLAAGCTNL